MTTGSGFPVPALTEAGGLPNGVTLIDNGNGTATLSGTPAAGSAGTYQIVITSSNGVSPEATQDFSVTVAPPALSVSQPPPLGQHWRWVSLWIPQTASTPW